MKKTVILGLAAISLLGCSSTIGNDGAAEAQSKVIRHDKCLRTACEAASQGSRDYCGDCWDACEDAVMGGPYIDCSQACRSSCDTSPTSTCTDDRCVEKSYSFQFLWEPDPAYEQACEAASANNLRCSADAVPGSCSDLAWWADPAKDIPMFRCQVAAGCGDSAHCRPPEEPLSAYCQSSCSSCSATMASIMNAALPDIQEAFRACFQEGSCTMVDACVRALVNEISRNPSGSGGSAGSYESGGHSGGYGASGNYGAGASSGPGHCGSAGSWY